MVSIDATTLLHLVQPGAHVARDSAGAPVAHARERVAALVADLEQRNETLIIAAPALAEVLVRTSASDAQRIVDEINRHAVFRIAAFDARAALEVAAMSRQGKKRTAPDSAATWAKLKYDRQIVAIAKVNGSSTLYSDDQDLRSLARTHGLKVVGLADLPLPPELEQADLFGEEETP